MEDLLEQLAQAWERRSEAGSRIFTVPAEVRYLDTEQLADLEKELRDWAHAAKRRDVRLSRRKILLLFLLIRHTGARLGEICACNPQEDYGKDDRSLAVGQGAARRRVPLPAPLADELLQAVGDGLLDASDGSPLCVDPGHLRRKLYEQADRCGLPRDLVSPSIIRRSRGIELLRQNVPLPVVQRLLGHSTPNLAGDYLDFSDEDMDKTLRRVVDRESSRTSARNCFFGRITNIERGDIQSAVRLLSVGGHELTAIITNGSLERLNFRVGSFATAAVKATWVTVSKTDDLANSAVNRFPGVIERITRGRLTTEVLVHLSDGVEVCSIITEGSRSALDLAEGLNVWVTFNAFEVILNAE
ncbi:MAG: TOBE domain-containing protein [Desulfovibrionaceae bacterium]